MNTPSRWQRGEPLVPTVEALYETWIAVETAASITVSRMFTLHEPNTVTDDDRT
jgi:hypothetical protein